MQFQKAHVVLQPISSTIKLLQGNWLFLGQLPIQMSLQQMDTLRYNLCTHHITGWPRSFKDGVRALESFLRKFLTGLDCEPGEEQVPGQIIRLKLKIWKNYCSNDIVGPLTSPHPGFLQDVWDSCMLLLSHLSLARAFSWLSSTSCWDTSCKVPGKVCKHFITSEEISEGKRTCCISRTSIWSMQRPLIHDYSMLQYWGCWLIKLRAEKR